MWNFEVKIHTQKILILNLPNAFLHEQHLMHCVDDSSAYTLEDGTILSKLIGPI